MSDNLRGWLFAICAAVLISSTLLALQAAGVGQLWFAAFWLLLVGVSAFFANQFLNN